jgi:hypothetical protein
MKRRKPSGNHESCLVAPEIVAAFGAGIIAAPVTFAVTGVGIEIAPFAAVFAAGGIGIVAIDFPGARGTVRCNYYGSDGISTAADHGN